MSVVFIPQTVRHALNELDLVVDSLGHPVAVAMLSELAHNPCIGLANGPVGSDALQTRQGITNKVLVPSKPCTPSANRELARERERPWETSGRKLRFERQYRAE